MEDALAYEDTIKLFWFENRMDVCRKFAKKGFAATVCRHVGRLCLIVGQRHVGIKFAGIKVSLQHIES